MNWITTAMNDLLNSHKIFVYGGELNDLTTRLSNFDLIRADNISVTDSGESLHGSYSIFHPSVVDAFIVDQGKLDSEIFRQSLIAYNYVENIALQRIFKGNALPIQQRPPIVIVTTNIDWITPELDEIIGTIHKSDLPVHCH